MADLNIHEAGAELAKRKKSWIPFVTPKASEAAHLLAERSHRKPRASLRKAASARKTTARGAARSSTRATGRSMNVHQAGAKLRRGPSGPTRSRAGSVVGKRSHSRTRAR
jgi:hypothetical protein